jgi:hypothetical protein
MDDVTGYPTDEVSDEDIAVDEDDEAWMVAAYGEPEA